MSDRKFTCPKAHSHHLSLHTVADVTGPARIIDGDLLEVAGEWMRLDGVDAPESRQLCFIDRKRWQCGKDAFK